MACSGLCLSDTPTTTFGVGEAGEPQSSATVEVSPPGVARVASELTIVHSSCWGKYMCVSEPLHSSSLASSPLEFSTGVMLTEPCRVVGLKITLYWDVWGSSHLSDLVSVSLQTQVASLHGLYSIHLSELFFSTRRARKLTLKKMKVEILPSLRDSRS